MLLVEPAEHGEEDRRVETEEENERVDADQGDRSQSIGVEVTLYSEVRVERTSGTKKTLRNTDICSTANEFNVRALWRLKAVSFLSS